MVSFCVRPCCGPRQMTHARHGGNDVLASCRQQLDCINEQDELIYCLYYLIAVNVRVRNRINSKFGNSEVMIWWVQGSKWRCRVQSEFSRVPRLSAEQASGETFREQRRSYDGHIYRPLLTALVLMATRGQQGGSQWRASTMMESCASLTRLMFCMTLGPGPENIFAGSVNHQ